MAAVDFGAEGPRGPSRDAIEAEASRLPSHWSVRLKTNADSSRSLCVTVLGEGRDYSACFDHERFDLVAAYLKALSTDFVQA